MRKWFTLEKLKAAMQIAESEEHINVYKNKKTFVYIENALE